EGAVVLQQVGECGGCRQIVEGDDLELGVALQECAEGVAADAAESVDGDAGHGGPFVCRIHPPASALRPKVASLTCTASITPLSNVSGDPGSSAGERVPVLRRRGAEDALE